ncbi:winged helix-turn-helix domain-containing protein [Streptomyces canarius]
MVEYRWIWSAPAANVVAERDIAREVLFWVDCSAYGDGQVDEEAGLKVISVSQHSYRSQSRRTNRPGKIQLLKASRAGSISAAGRALGMSYKRAWDLVDEINRICNQTAVERQVGGKHGGGAVLTRFGALLVDQYREIEVAARTPPVCA